MKLTMEVKGLKVLTPYSWEYENYKVAVSYMTVLIYENGCNIGSLYPQSYWDGKQCGSWLRDWCKDMPEKIATAIGTEVLKVVVFDD